MTSIHFLTPSIHFGKLPLPVNPKVNHASALHTHALSMKDFSPLMHAADFDMMKEGGFKVVRTDLLWSAVEKKPGQFDFSQYDQFIKELKDRDLQPMIILGLGNPLYDEGRLSIHPKSVQEAFERYAKAAVQHFKGQGIIWELVQQPNHDYFWQAEKGQPAIPNAKKAEEYTALALKLLPILKALDPDAGFVAPSLAGHATEFQKICSQKGLLDWTDAVSVHPYRNDRLPESIIDKFKQSLALIQNGIRETGRKIPILLGEWGYDRTKVKPETQADYAVRQYLIGQMLGSPINAWHDWKGDIFGVTDEPGNAEQQYGMVNRDLKPFPVFTAVQKMHQALNGHVYKERLASHSDDYLLVFEKEDKGNEKPQRTLAAWTIGEPHSIAMDFYLHDMASQQSAAESTEAQKEQKRPRTPVLQLNGRPQFVPLK